MGEYLCVGDYICLYCEETEGYVYSVQSSSTENGVYIFNQQSRSNPSNIPTQSAVIFQICIQNRYKLNKKHRNWLSKNEAESALPEVLKQAREAAEAEDHDNAAEQKRQHGKTVRYGEIVQLKHMFSGKYIHTCTTQTSQRDKNNMMISLHEFNAKNAQFKILPRYKVKSEGEVVQLHDQIVFESIKSPGHYFHASHKFQIDYYTEGSELNLGVERSSFTLIGSHRINPDQSKFVRGGSVIRLFHKELEAYLVAEGLFEESITEDVHFRVRIMDQHRPKTMSPSSSGITYWEIEAESSILDGDIIHWEQQIRLRHLTTRQYLCINNKCEVCLTPEQTDPRTVFRLHSVLKERDQIQYESYARIEHMLSGCWLHALKDEDYERHSSRDTDEQSMSSLRWDGAATRKISATNESLYDDAYTLQYVHQDDVHNFNFVAGMVPMLFNLIKAKNHGHHLNARKTHGIIEGIKELKTFMLPDGEPNKDRQKLMRNLRVIDLFVNILQFPLTDNEEAPLLIRIFKECYDVLHAYMIGRSRKNALYFAKYIDFFQTQFSQKGGIGLNVAQMIVELIRDNRKIVDRIGHSNIDKFITLLLENPNYRFLDLLQVLCVCADVAIPNNQSYIVQNWLRTYKDSIYLLDRGQNINKRPNIVYISIDGGNNWIPLHSFVDSESPIYIEEKYMFLMHQLDLFKALSYGRNDFAIHVITREYGYLSWEDCFLCLQSELLPHSIRAKFCELVICLFIDVSNNCSVLDHPNICFVYEYVGSKDSDREQSQYVVKDLVTIFPVLRDWLANFLGQNCVMIASLVGHNLLIEQVLRLLQHLVKFGYYMDTDDIKQLMGPLLTLLDGRRDVPFPEDTVKKKKGYTKEAQKAIQIYRNEGRFERSPETEAIVNAKFQAMEVLDLLFAYQRNIRLKAFVTKFKLAETQAGKRKKESIMEQLLYETYDPQDKSTKACKKQKEITKELREMFHQSAIFDIEATTVILMDLINYKYDKMVIKSLDIMNKMYSSQSDMFKFSLKTQVLLTNDSARVHREVQRSLPTLRRMSKAKLSEQQVEIMCQILDELAEFCHLPKTPEEPHHMNQNIMISHGILNIVLDILSQEIDSKLQDQYKDVKTILQKTLFLLRLLLRENNKVQSIIFEKLDTLLDVKGVESDLALALKEVFVANQVTCLKVYSRQIQKIVLLAAEHQEKAPEFLDLLKVLVKVHGLDLTLKRNQTLVMKYIMQNFKKAAYVLDQSKEMKERILTNQTDPGQLTYLVCLVDLLATCAEGENKFIDSLCQTILPIEELIWILNNRAIYSNVKTPFLKFLFGVYVSLGEDGAETMSSDLQHDKNVWEFISNAVNDINNLTDAVNRHLDRAADLLKSPPPLSAIADGQDTRASVHGNLYYFLEGVLPFFQIFFTGYYTVDRTLYPYEITHTDNVANGLLAFCDVVGPMLVNPTHMKTMVSCLSAVVSASNISKTLLIGVLEKFTTEIKFDGIKCAVRKGNMEYYAAEIELNAKFHTFAKHCSTVYCGHNTVAAQLKYKSKNEYTVLGSHEELPLGEEFQNFVRCFIVPGEKNMTARYAPSKKLVDLLAISGKLQNHSSSLTTYKPNEDLDIKCLQILRALVVNEERKLPENWETRSSSPKIKKLTDNIRETQNAINSHNAIITALPLTARRNEAVTKEVLAFIVIMLFNANRSVQKSMYDYFISTREEVFFMACRYWMQASTNSIKEKRYLMTQQQARLKESGNTLNNPSAFYTVGRKAMQQIQGYEQKLRRDKFNGWENDETDAAMTPMMENMAEMFQYKDDGHIELVLKLFARLCDGQNTGIQNYLREQPDNIKSFNIVAETAQFLNIVYSNINDKTIDLVIQLFSTLNEFCSGNQENRVVMHDRKIIDYINFILRAGEMQDCPSKKVLELRLGIARLIISLIEENGHGASEIAKEVKDTLDKKAICEGMTWCYELAQSEKTKMEDFIKVGQTNYIQSAKSIAQFGGNLLQEVVKGKKTSKLKEMVLETGFMLFLIIARMIDIDPGLIDSLSLTPEQMKAFGYYKKNVQSIEIVKDDILQKINFRVRNKKVLREEVKEKLKWSVDRSSPSNKIRDLMDWTRDIMKDIIYQRKILHNPIAMFFTHCWLLWNHGTTILSLAINIVMLVTWNSKASMEDYKKFSGDAEAQKNILNQMHDSDPVIREINKKDYDIILLALGSIHNIFSLFVFITYLLSNHPRLPHWSEIVDPIRRLCGKDESEEEEKAQSKEISKLDVKFFSFRTFYYMLFLGMSIAGTFSNGYFFAFHLLNVVNNNQLLAGVIKAVTQNGYSLLWVAILGIIVIYIYALVGFALFRNSFNPESHLYCASLWQCTVTVIRYGLIGDMFEILTQSAEENAFSYFWPIALYHLSFFIFITTIGLNIIFGIIVDTFSELRDLKWRAESDMKDTCFICSRNSYDFEHHGKGFDAHVKSEHNMWAYIYFIIHLDTVQSSEYTALELFVYKLKEKENYDFIPLNRALCLSTSDLDSTESKIDELLYHVTAISHKQKEDEFERKRQVEKKRQRKWQEKHRRFFSVLVSNDSDRETLFESATKKLLTGNISHQPSTTSKEDDLPPPPPPLPPPPPPLDTLPPSNPLPPIQQFEQEPQNALEGLQELLQKPDASTLQTLLAPPKCKKLTRSDHDVYDSDNVIDSTSDSESESVVGGPYTILREEDTSSVKDTDTTKIELPLELVGLAETPEDEDQVSPQGDDNSLTGATSV